VKKTDTASASNIVDTITAFNAGRDPERLTRKYQILAADPFSFLRGTCHLFYRDFQPCASMERAPLAWICGDLHLENFGSYKADNRLTYFDLNDFDEALLAPASWDLCRFLVSVLVAAEALKVDSGDAIILCHRFLDAYVAALSEGKARWVERATATGMVKDLLCSLSDRTRPAFLDRRTDIKRGRRKLRLDGIKALQADDAQRDLVTSLMAEYAQTQSEPAFFKVLDVARRIAGTGSLGLERYVLLVRGRGGIDGNFLLDLKHAPGSALSPYVQHTQPRWGSEAERVVTIKRRVQANSPAFLSALSVRDRSYVLQELQPSQDRLSLESWGGKLRRLGGVMQTMGSIVGWAHLRAGGYQGSACADEWISFGSTAADWRDALLDSAQAYRQQVNSDWKEYSTAYRTATKAQDRSRK
jgi:uncharacterized protein (DUF2252 family)